MKVFVIIPSHNEGSRLTKLLKKIRRLHSRLPVIVIDDGSKKPVTITQTPHLTLLQHKLNLGKGAALTTGIEYAFAQKADAVILMDADLQHDPKEIKTFLKHLQAGSDIVFGSRRQTLDTPLIRFLGNKFASIYISLLFGVYIADILSGFRALNKKAYKVLKWSSSHYGVETEIVARLGKNKHKLKYSEFPIQNIYIDKYKGVTILDAIKILLQSVAWKLS